MRLTVFRSDKGDCLLLTTSDGKRLLVDGGMPTSYSAHVAPALAALKPPRIDVVCVSHVDQDHLGGVLRLFEDRQRQRGAGKLEIGRLWHNGFSAELHNNAGPIRNTLRRRARIFGEDAAYRDRADESGSLAASIGEAIELRNHSSAARLGVPVNPEANGGLLLARRRPAARLRVGAVDAYVLAPKKEDLLALREDWNEWLRKNRRALARLKRQAEGLAASEGPRAAQLARLLEDEQLAASDLDGKRTAVTVPNLASLMLLAVEGRGAARRRVLLTGDGHWEDILEGLRRVPGVEERLHVDVLKVQHHGSKNCISDRFCEAVTADHYVFCGNGKHGNPSAQVVEAIAAARVRHGPGRPYKLWFNSSSAAADAVQPHMRKIEVLVKRLARAHPRLRFEFLSGASFEIPVGEPLD